jgi:purine catabolism regulator
MLPHISVADVLALAEVQAGEPEIVAGALELGREVRWAHVVAGSGAAALLDGGELVLTTGAGWPTEPAALANVSRALVDADPAAVFLELGTHVGEAPPVLREACEERGVPLVALHREVRFVQITQRIHQRILDAQQMALQARADVHTMLTELGLNRSPVDYVIAQLALTVGAPVVLENSAGQVVAWSGSQQASEVVLSPWLASNPRGVSLPTDSDRVPVEAQGTRWGYLSALPGPEHPAGRRTVLELGALALALGRLADSDEDQWLRLSSKHLFDVLLEGRYRHDTELTMQLTAAGLPVEGRVLLGATLRGTGPFGAHESLERAVLETALRRAVAPEGRVILTPDTAAPSEHPSAPPLLALLSFPAGDSRIAASPATPPLATRLAREIDMLLPSTTPRAWRAHLGLGEQGHGLRSLITSLERVRAAGQLAPSTSTGRVTVQEAEGQALAYLVRGLSSLPAVQQFATTALGPLLEHDAVAGPGHSGDLVQVLGAYLEHPTNRSLAAERARLSRSVFYGRLALIEQLLGVDLSDGNTIATLSVALLARGSARGWVRQDA